MLMFNMRNPLLETHANLCQPCDRLMTCTGVPCLLPYDSWNQLQHPLLVIFLCKAKMFLVAIRIFFFNFLFYYEKTLKIYPSSFLNLSQ